MSDTTAKPPEPGNQRPNGSTDAYLGRLVAAWVAHVRRRAGTVIALFLVATALLGTYAAMDLGVNSSETDIFSKNLRVMKLRADYYENFPELRDPVVVVVDAVTPDLAQDSANRLARRLQSEPELFPGVYQPDGGKFFDEHGLLYLSVSELQDMVDRLSLAQPFLSRLSRDQSIGGLFTMLDEAGEAMQTGQLEQSMLADIFESVSGAIDGYLAGRDTPMSWRQLLDASAPGKQRYRRFLLVRPVVDFSRMRPAGDTLLGLRKAVAELGLDRNDDVRVRVTGTFPLADEESKNLRVQATWAGLASLALVTVILLVGLGSLRLVVCSVITLLVGLVWTAGFAAAAIGYLNLVSVAFAVLFIGLSIDFAIHLSVQFSGQLGKGASTGVALRGAASSVGGSCTICAITTAVAFFAFVPTDFVGVGELGLIAGTGMFIGLLTNFTLLPALIFKFAHRSRIRSIGAVPGWLASLFALPVRFARSVLVVTAVIAVAALWLLPDIRFDTNPIRVRDPSTDSVQLFNEILEDGDAFPWNLNVVADDLDSARETASRLEKLPEIKLALTLSDFVPDDQQAKLDILDQAALMLLPSLDNEPGITDTTGAQVRSRIDKLETTLSALIAGGRDTALVDSARDLLESLGRLREKLASGVEDSASLEALRGVLFDSLPERLRLLRGALQTDSVELAGIPEQLKRRMTGKDGRVRIEVLPVKDLSDQPALEEYVVAVQSVDPDAYGEGLLIVDSGRVVIGALRQALMTAGIIIILILAILWRNFLDAFLVAAPLVLATVLTVASAIALGITFNFANVIIIPLLLGMGIDSGIHMVHRVREGALPGGNLLRTGTARAVFLSALTTMASFGTLGFSSHLGIASLGQLLTLGIALVLLSNLLVLPALVRITHRERR
ncbi:MAG: MMPL family transporter [Gammaproteobacteria bacterium]|nr:MAG: MMPL family transporter [Gammaproteobacteria bacterium]